MSIIRLADRVLPQPVVKLLESEGTGISWADLTMNFWIGCQEVSPACDHCYARDFTNARVNAARAAAGKPPIVWGPGGARHQTAEANRKKPLRWNLIAAEAGVRLRVFCSSLSDWADNAVPDEWRAEIAATIIATPWLDWMLLTKRIGNAHEMLTKMFPDGVPPNAWIGSTICNQDEARRDITKLLMVKSVLGISKVFLSIEPMLSAINLTHIELPYSTLNAFTGVETDELGECGWCVGVDLVICGGESGQGARPMHPDWARALRDQCAAAGVPFHFKQWGEWLPTEQTSPDLADDDGTMRLVMTDFGIDYGDLERGAWGDHRDISGMTVRVGTRKAGHLLDGVEHREMPA